MNSLTLYLLAPLAVSFAQHVEHPCVSNSSSFVVYEKAGSDLVLEVAGKGDSFVQWMAMKGTANIKQSELARRLRGGRSKSVNGRLVVKSVDKLMNGTVYKFSLKSPNDETRYLSPWMVLAIAEPPRVRHHYIRKHFQVLAGKDIQICPNVTGIPTPGVHIFKNSTSDETVSYSNRFKPSSRQGCFEISNLRRDDSGQYIVSAENCIGKETTSFTIEVQPLLCYQIVSSPKDEHSEVILWGHNNKRHNCGDTWVGTESIIVYALEDEDLTLKAKEKKNGRSRTTVIWVGRKGWATLTTRQLAHELSSRRVNFANDRGFITLKSLHKKLNGTELRYREIEGDITYSYSGWVRLIIGGSPHITLVSHNSFRKMNVTEGESPPPICISVSGIPNPEILLYQSTVETLEPKQMHTKRYNFSNGCLHVSPVGRGDGGKLVVVATNCFGSSSLVLGLTIQIPYPCDDNQIFFGDPPVVTVQPSTTIKNDETQGSTIKSDLHEVIGPTATTSPVSKSPGSKETPSTESIERRTTVMASQARTKSSQRVTEDLTPNPNNQPSAAAQPSDGTVNHRPLAHTEKPNESGTVGIYHHTHETSIDSIRRSKGRETVLTRTPTTDSIAPVVVFNVSDLDTTDASTVDEDMDTTTASTHPRTIKMPATTPTIESAIVFINTDSGLNYGNNFHNNKEVDGSLPFWLYVVIGTATLILVVIAVTVTVIVLRRRRQYVPEPVPKDIPTACNTTSGHETVEPHLSTSTSIDVNKYEQ
ncbi:uncharacterized protein LOC134177132 isoform X2 [Corticium candelabrum]|uniref:uncharacterized protein LOC134177132 isoform X2 n=1 Tax=Corticium candelabrum TaxID=121492 RepID=UPI002E25AA5A|nr:uncharacterized protein LOC134177132 isoform X2 [Corticium candelabrum]